MIKLSCISLPVLILLSCFHPKSNDNFEFCKDRKIKIYRYSNGNILAVREFLHDTIPDGLILEVNRNGTCKKLAFVDPNHMALSYRIMFDTLGVFDKVDGSALRRVGVSKDTLIIDFWKWPKCGLNIHPEVNLKEFKFKECGDSSGYRAIAINKMNLERHDTLDCISIPHFESDSTREYIIEYIIIDSNNEKVCSTSDTMDLYKISHLLREEEKKIKSKIR